MARTALVTGASAGIGWACAQQLAKEGWEVYAASRRGTAPEGCRGVVMDVDDDRSVTEGTAEILAGAGTVDAVVTCAGWGLGGAMEDTPLADARAQMETNFWGTVRVLQAVLPSMRAAGGGRVVLMSSIGGVIALPFQSFYSASKFALEGLAESLAYEVAPFGVKVSLVQPGNIKTDFTARRRTLPGSQAYEGAMSKAISVMERDERNGAPASDVAKAVSRLLTSSRPPRRISVGRAGERVGLVAKRALPFSLFQAAAKGSLGV